MAVSTTDTYSGPYTANGVTVAFPFTFKAASAAEVRVFLAGSDGSEAEFEADEYSVTLSAPGGTVTFATAPPSGTLYVESRPDFKQPIAFASGQPYQPQTVNEANDRAAIRDLYLRTKIDRAPTAPVGGGAEGQFPVVLPDGSWGFGSGTGSDPALRNDLALSTGDKGAGIIAWRQTADYSQGTAADKLKYTVYVNDAPFLAKGDDIANDTAAIQAAIDYGKTIAGDSGVTIKFRSGSYIYDSLLVDRSDICLAADGDVRLLKTGTTGNGVQFKAPTGTRIFRVGVVGLKFGNAYDDATAGSAVYFENCGTCYARDIGYSRYPAAPCDVIYTYRCAGFSFRNVHGAEAVGTGIKCVGTLDVKGAFSTLDVNGRHGVELDRCAGVNMTEVVNYGNALNGFYTHADVPVEDVGDISNRSVFHYYTQCVGDTSGQDNWKIKDTQAIFGDQCWGSTQHTNDPDRVGFSFEQSYGFFNGIRARLNNGDGIFVGPGSFVVFDGGESISNGRIAASDFKSGVRCEGEMIVGNVNFWNETGLELQEYGIAIPLINPANMVRISNNRFRGMLNAAFEPMSAADYTDVQMSGNGADTSRSIASATTPVIPPEFDGAAITITGTADIYDFTPKWDGRRVDARFASTARVIHGTAMKLPSANIQPGANGRAVFEYSVAGTCWELITVSINDGA